MLGKLQYLEIAILILEKKYKHSYIVSIYIDITFTFIVDGLKFLIKTFKVFFQAILIFIIKIK